MGCPPVMQGARTYAVAAATLAASLILAGGCAGGEVAPGTAGDAVAPGSPGGAAVLQGDDLARLFSDEVDVVDLTHPLSQDSVFWPNSAGNPFRYEILRAQPSGAAATGRYSTPEHHGTHLDAPIHSGDGLPSVDALTPGDLFGPAAVIDVREAAAADPDYELRREDLATWEARNGTLPAGAIVLMSSGWARKYDDPDAYRNQDDEGRMHFPGFSTEAARFLIEERQIRGIGIDTLSVDPGATRGLPVHGIVNGSGKFHLENVANVDLLPEAGAYLIVAPIKIKGGSGGQVRIFALVPRPQE